jgi:hypothetical protein
MARPVGGDWFGGVMSTTAPSPSGRPMPRHPLLSAVADMSAALDGVSAAGVDPLYLPTREKRTLLIELTTWRRG